MPPYVYPARASGGLHTTADGFGHFTELLGDGRTAVWHGGQSTGWMTHFQLGRIAQANGALRGVLVPWALVIVAIAVAMSVQARAGRPWLGVGVLVTALLALAGAALPRRADR